MNSIKICNLTDRMHVKTTSLLNTWLWKLNTAGTYSTWLSPSFLHLQNVPPTNLGRSHTEFFTERSVNRRFFCLSHETVDGNKAIISISQTNFPFQHLIYTFHQLSGRKRFKRQSGHSMTTCLTVGSKFSREAKSGELSGWEFWRGWGFVFAPLLHHTLPLNKYITSSVGKVHFQIKKS